MSLAVQRLAYCEGKGGKPDMYLDKDGTVWISKPSNATAGAWKIPKPMELFGFGYGDFEVKTPTGHSEQPNIMYMFVV
jgi:hypothetical protein